MFQEFIDDFIDQYSDPRMRGIFTVWEPVTIVAIYMILVQKLGPWFMKNRQPYNVKKYVMVFDAIQVAANVYFVIQVLKAILVMTGSYFCLDIDLSDSDEAINCIYLTKFYYWLKISDLLDTIFFVLRKSWRQVSYLHVYHHSTMIFISWMALKLVPGGHCAYFGLANSFVHTFMYTYYLLTAYDPSFKKNIALKKSITQIQLIQFVFLVCIYVPSLSSSCSYPKPMAVAAVTQASYFLYLFGMFYYNTYIKVNQGHIESKDKLR